MLKLFESTKSLNKYDPYLRLLNCYFEAIYDLGDSQKYYNYKAKVLEQKKNMSTDDLEYHITCLISYCFIKKKIADSYDEFSKEYILLQETILREKLFINSKSEFYLKENYLNLLVNYDSYKEKEKIQELLAFAKHLHPDFRQDLIHLSNAYYDFLNFSYEKSLSSIAKINKINKAFEEKVYNLEIRIYYEKKDFVDCLESINLFKKQLRTNTLLDKQKIKAELAFLSHVEKLIKITEDNSKIDAGYLKNKISKDDTIPNKEWVGGKIQRAIKKGWCL